MEQQGTFCHVLDFLVLLQDSRRSTAKIPLWGVVLRGLAGGFKWPRAPSPVTSPTFAPK